MRSFLRIICVLGDYLLLIGTLTLVIRLRTVSYAFENIFTEYRLVFFPSFILWLFVFYLFDFYNFDVPPKLTKYILCISITSLLTTTIFYFLSDKFIISPKTNMAIFTVVFSLAFYAWRRFVELLFIKILHGHEIMMAVSDEDSLNLAVTIFTNPRLKYTLKGVLVTKELYSSACKEFPQEMIYTDSVIFEKDILTLKILTIVSTSLWFSRLYGNMYELFPQGIRIINMINFHERVLGYIPVHSTSQYWIINNFDLVSRRLYMTIKRLLDVCFSIVIFPVFLIIMLGVVILLKLFGEKNASLIYSQKRVGHRNKEFVLYKFRTMYMDAEKKGAQWAVKEDPRITKIGKFLRLTRLDELPQIFNIIRGDMSFIGPRPERMEFVKELVKTIPHYHIRHTIRPGLSGWAQVKFRYGSSENDASIKLCYDLFYIKNIGIVLDTRIFFKTIVTILHGMGR